MAKTLTNRQLQDINRRIADRHDVFYWQTDRAISEEEASLIWADRHRYFTDKDILEAANRILTKDKLISIEPFRAEAQTNLGTVNSVRVGKLASGDEVVVRCHPRGVQNGYFYAESLAAGQALDAGLPSYKTLAVHELEGIDDFAFQVCQKLPGTAMKHWLSDHPEDETKLLFEVGACLARLHRLAVEGFGPFDNHEAKQGTLVGLHKSFASAVRAGLPFNLKTLVDLKALTSSQAAAVDKLLDPANPLLACDQAVLIHNDFADWNMLTDGSVITGMIDWDECVGGDPVSDIACWSTFFPPERLAGMLKGYWSVATKPADFEEKFELLRLRYVVTKMTLRLRRYQWDKSENLKMKIEAGQQHLAASLRHFDID